VTARDARPGSDDVCALGARDLAGAIAARELSAVEVMRAFLARIDRANPHVNAVVARRDTDELLDEAARADAVVARGDPVGALHGLPHAVKDLASAAGLGWTAGSPLFADRVGVVDDPHVRRIRAAGALIVGKTTVPEFGFGSQTTNPVHGTTRNPYDPTRTAGGSSGGAAAALALRMLPVADGSDYMGSLRNPASFCNVFGFRPSLGRVAKPGFLPQMGEAGPMARSLDDLELLLRVMSGPDASAPLSRVDPLGPVEPPDDLRGVRVGWLGDLGGQLAIEPGVLETVRGAAAVMADLGATVEDVLPAFDLDRLWRAFLVWRWWGALELAPLLDDPATRAQLKPEAVWETEHARELTVPDLQRAVADRDAWYAVVAELFTRYDVLLAPSAQVLPFDGGVMWPGEIDGRSMDTYHRWMETVAPWTFAAGPVLGMPAGFLRGLPVGVQLIGPPGADARVLALGRVHEAATRWVERMPPPALTG